MVVNNKLTEIGDVLLFGTRIPLAGVTTFLSFNDVVVGETGTRFFTKQFRYSFNGINFSTWIGLTLGNLAAINFGTNTQIYVDFWYERSGADDTGELEFDSLNLGANFVPYRRAYPIGIKSIFKDIVFSSPEIMDLALNLTRKLYSRGIIPEYMDRAELNDVNLAAQDVDYVVLMKAISHFFAMMVIYFKQFENIYYKREFLIEYLKQRGLFISEDEAIDTFQYLVSNYYDEIRQRGTLQIARKSGHVYADGSTKNVHGELMRLIAFQDTDEFLFNVVPKQSLGWNIGNSSPLYKGCTNQTSQINKSPDNSPDADSRLPGEPDYPLQSNGVTTQMDMGKKAHRLLGVDQQLGFLTNVNENIDYEFTFWARLDTPGDKLHVYAYFKNSAGAFFNYVKNLDDTVDATGFLMRSVSLYRQDKYYFVRCIIYAKDKNLQTGQRVPNIGAGENKKMYTGVATIQMNIGTDSTNFGSLYVWDVKMKPLNTPFSTGFVQTTNFIEIWMKNNNFGSFDTPKIEEMIRYYLIPYNSTFKTIQL